MKMSSCAFTRGWPMYSASLRGRTARSNASSSRAANGATTPRLFSIVNGSLTLSPRSSLGYPLAVHASQRLANHFFRAEPHAVEVLQHLQDFARLVTEREQRTVRLAFRLRAC